MGQGFLNNERLLRQIGEGLGLDRDETEILREADSGFLAAMITRSPEEAVASLLAAIQRTYDSLEGLVNEPVTTAAHRTPGDAAGDGGSVADQRLMAALATCLEAVAALDHWPVGHALIATSGGEELVSTGLWHMPEEAAQGTSRAVSLERLRRQRQSRRFPAGIGIAGHAMAGGQPVWLEMLSERSTIETASSLLECGLRSAMAFPIQSEAGVLAVIELFAFESRPVNEPAMELFGELGRRLGVRLAAERRTSEEPHSVAE